ncbi:Phosphoribosyl-ATP pyrophosphatase [Candidatus Johnevansia muelleri]|uniref:Phosphoribosyl-ATP pyrophosphatase n=1 Tax=Candidatus Johnevansia muelleri TaxID=1495769 RepID=A0A078KAX0_9GAMM|nr:Phosphoribosyl-ATP pyrophosphatase [Candidatus Evansia muelleri]
MNILKKLYFILEERRYAAPEISYVGNLHCKGINKILEKIGEETTELIIAAKDISINKKEENKTKVEIIKETADLWFHSLVMLSHFYISHQEVLDELAKRLGISGLEEKASRVCLNFAK